MEAQIDKKSQNIMQLKLSNIKNNTNNTKN